jgi:lipid-A-disaccharide synthase
VLFLGGDQFFPVVIGKRLSYKIVIYAEWAARWARWVDRFAVINGRICKTVPPQYQSKCTIVGDLMVDRAPEVDLSPNQTEILGILPGSKAMKLAQGVPGAIAIAHYLHQLRPQTHCAIVVAPTVTVAKLLQFSDPAYNPVAAQVLKDLSIQLIDNEGQNPYLLTSSGVKIALWTAFPHTEDLRQCTLCFTTIGANTAQLTALGIPMIVGIPIWQIDAMRAWDGLPGLLANTPFIGKLFSRLFNSVMYQVYIRRRRLYAWPNIWAGQREIVPELVGDYSALDFAKIICQYLEHPEKLAQMRQELCQVRGDSGASDRVAQLVFNVAQELGIEDGGRDRA